MFATGQPFAVELGPGLLGGVFDGVQRLLPRLAAVQGNFLGRGQHTTALDRDRLWDFEPSVKSGDFVRGGSVLGTVQETAAIEHRVLVPPTLCGRVADVSPRGPHRVVDIVATLAGDDGSRTGLTLFHTWRVRRPRPVSERLPPSMPMLTGQRVLDTFFPLPRGGACGMPGGFGTGKTIMQQQLCKWAEADVIVYVGCGERGNEMTEMLSKLPNLVDPRSGRPLAERTILVANTSNMPVPAREASIYTGATIAEYYRDMGYQVALLADMYVALGGSVAGNLRTARRNAGRGRVSPIPIQPSCELLRTGRPGPNALRQRGVGHVDLGDLAAWWGPHRARHAPYAALHAVLLDPRQSARRSTHVPCRQSAGIGTVTSPTN